MFEREQLKHNTGAAPAYGMTCRQQQRPLWRNPVPAGLCAIFFFVLLGLVWPGGFVIAAVIALLADMASV